MIDKYIKRIVSVVKPPIITSLGVKMRNPFNEKGEWIGWTAEEIAAHFASVNQYKSTIPLKEPHKENKNGCDRG
jgi:hypothetical protein